MHTWAIWERQQETFIDSTVFVNAQLTHLICRDDAAQGQDAPIDRDAPMPDPPTVHDIAAPRRMIGGRCRKWCISAQLASGKRECAACNLCGIRFNHSEARLQQWSNRETNIKDLRGTTFVQPPTRFKFALQQAQHAILRAIIHNNPPHWRQSQLGKRWCSAAGSFWDDLQSTSLRATAHTFWMRVDAQNGQAADAVTCSQSCYISMY